MSDDLSFQDQIQLEFVPELDWLIERAMRARNGDTAAGEELGQYFVEMNEFRAKSLLGISIAMILTSAEESGA